MGLYGEGAIMGTVFVNGPDRAYDFESITVSGTAIGCTAAKIKVLAIATGTGGTGAPASGRTREATSALITVEGQAIRFRLDGTAPTASVGHQLNPGDSLQLEGYDAIARFLAIRVDAADATLRVTYFRRS